MSIARGLFDLGYTDLVSVIPPGAPLSSGSRIDPKSRGKVPGVRTDLGWAGYAWDRPAKNSLVDKIDATGASIGFRAMRFPGLDVDSGDIQLTIIVVNTAHEILGVGPARFSVEPRRLLIYRTDEPFKKRVLHIKLADGSKHAVEMLADGQQYLVHGQHQSGNLYRFEGSKLPKDPTDLPLIDTELVDRFFLELTDFLRSQGASVSLSTKGALARQLNEEVKEGARNSTLASIAGTLQRRALPLPAIVAALWETNLSSCVPPLDREEVETIAESVYRYEPTEDLVVLPASQEFEVQELPKERPVFKRLTPSELKALVVPEEEWLLRDLIPVGGSSLLVAKPKVGKSTFARGFAVAVAEGRPFLERELEAGRVMYVMFPNEGTEREAKVEFMRLGAKNDANFSFYYDLARDATKAEIITYLAIEAKRFRPTLIVIDTLQGLVRAKDLNDYANVYNNLAPVRAIAEPTGAHLCYVYHAGKGQKLDLMDETLGSTALAGAVEVVLVMKRDLNVQTTRLLAARGRGVEFEAHVISVDEETHEPILGTTYSVWKSENMQTLVLAALADVNEFVKRGDVPSLVGSRRKDVLSALDLLVESGAVAVRGTGKRNDPKKYGIPEGVDEFQKQFQEEFDAKDRIEPHEGLPGTPKSDRGDPGEEE